ncbi:polysaccharide biosynthesis protein [Clostridium disporicum]|uniref:Capsular polysaccharide biosynthesis protein n=1 Tax=Clostridium disporicum TaxID=84024 RepID=A0A174L2V0_9CLOT|nr:nucleoside-diphosphate sugar epimerase/dehydratase [Clostridium disporicum]CUP17016.1 capsular polysaccharide biosynthesis protein [Clostridium disporicum]
MQKESMLKDVLKNRKIKISILMLSDIGLILSAYMLGFIFRFYSKYFDMSDIVRIYKNHIPDIMIAVVIYIVMLFLFKQYKNIWSLAGINEFANGGIAILLSVIINLLITSKAENRLSLFVTILSGLIILLFYIGIRVSWKLLVRMLDYKDLKKSGVVKDVLIVGAGSAGALVLNEFKKNPQFGKNVVALIDDDKQKLKSLVGGVKVLGNRDDIERIAEEYKIDEIIIAISELEKSDLKNILEKCKNAKAHIKIMPGVSEMIDGKFSINKIRDVDVEDLLGRDSITLDHDGISDYLEDKVVLVTGGGGSIGSELCRQIAKFKPKQLIIFDIYENNAYDIQNELRRNYPELNLETLIGSVRDKKRLKEVFSKYRPQVVFHAAAHKHVPLMEDSPAEAIKNNVKGTLNVAQCADGFKVERFVLISTDKAVNPTNIMGATKRMCEMIIQSINKESKTEFVAVRFGNVLGSNGSVVPLFKNQIAKGGPVTLTHKDITRYFMTIPEAAQLVLQAGAYAEGGEIFVLDMGKPVRIYDLAENLIKLSGYEPHKDIKIEVTGLRPGEKLYEELLMNEEGLTETKHKKIFIGKSSDFEIDKVKSNVDELLKVAALGNKDILKEKMKEIVTTYKEPDEVNSKVNKIG